MTTWPLIPVGEVITHRKEFIQVGDSSVYKRCRVQLHAQGVVLRDEVPGIEIKTKAQQVCRAGEFLVAEIDAKVGGFGIVPPNLEGAIVSSHYFLFTVNRHLLDVRFLGYYVKTAAFRHQVMAQGSTNYAAIRPSHVLAYTIPLPPIEEQRRIVERIELFSTKVTRIERLRAETRGETQVLWKRLLATTIGDYISNEVQLHEICTAIIDNLHSNPAYADAGVPCVRSPDVGWGELNLASAFRTDEAEYVRRTVRGRPEADDIVLVREGGGTGKAALVLSGQRFSLGQRVMMLRPDRSRILPKFFLYQILSPLIQDDQIQPVSKGSASPHLNIGALRRFRVKLPSLDEQHHLVSRLDQFRKSLTALREHQAKTTQEIDALMPSVLNQVFSGQL